MGSEMKNLDPNLVQWTVTYAKLPHVSEPHLLPCQTGLLLAPSLSGSVHLVKCYKKTLYTVPGT